MKKLLKYCSLTLLLSLLAFSSAGCEKESAKCPFTDAKWGDTLDDLEKLEDGEYTEGGESAYNGTVYEFPKEYEGLDGIIRYSFDAEEKLVAMSWMYETDDSEDLKETYDTLHEGAEKLLGESGFTYNSDKFADAATPGDVWYREEGNVIIIAVDTDEAKLLQYTFMHPDVSEKRPEK